MAERRTTSLLDFAIAASIAVVPIMLAIAAAGGRDPPGRARRGRMARPARSLRERAPGRRAEDLRGGHRAAPGAGGAADRAAGARRPAAVPARVARAWRAGLAGVPAGTHAPAPPAEQIAAGWQRSTPRCCASARAPTRASAQPVGIDAARWFAAAEQEPGRGPSRRPSTRASVSSCAAPIWPTRWPRSRVPTRRLLDALAWRGTESGATLARWRPEQQMEITAHQVTRRNPWNGIAGCIYLGRRRSRRRRGADALHRRRAQRAAPAVRPARDGRRRRRRQRSAARAAGALVGEPGLADAVDDTRWMVPPSLHAMLQPLESLRQPSGSLYRLYTDAEAAAAGRPRRATATARTASCSTARRSTSASRST